jgi:hypothetical protein
MQHIHAEIKMDALAYFLIRRVFLNYFIDIMCDIVCSLKHFSNNGQHNELDFLLLGMVFEQMNARLQSSLQW